MSMIPVNNTLVAKEATEELENRLRLFVNMIIDKVLEDRKKGIIKGLNIKKEYD